MAANAVFSRRLNPDSQDAAERCQYERAQTFATGSIVCGTCTNGLNWLREPALPSRFVYPVQVGRRQVWYLLADGRVVSGMPAPSSTMDAGVCLEHMRRSTTYLLAARLRRIGRLGKSFRGGFVRDATNFRRFSCLTRRKNSAFSFRRAKIQQLVESAEFRHGSDRNL